MRREQSKDKSASRLAERLTALFDKLDYKTLTPEQAQRVSAMLRDEADHIDRLIYLKLISHNAVMASAQNMSV